MSISILKRPSALIPLAMSLAALGLVLGHIALYGAAREPDEGLAAHLWQMLMAGQIPVIAFFAIKWLPRTPAQALLVLVLEAVAGSRRHFPFSSSSFSIHGISIEPPDDNGDMSGSVPDYVKAIPSEHRPLFDRIHRLVLDAHPDATVMISYKIPTYKVGDRRLFVGVWKHGVSIYGWGEGRDGGFTARHPEFKSGKGTIQLRTEDAARIPDAEIRALARAVLGG